MIDNICGSTRILHEETNQTDFGRDSQISVNVLHRIEKFVVFCYPNKHFTINEINSEQFYFIV